MTVNGRLALGAHAFTTAGGDTLTYFVCGQGPRLLVAVAPGWGCASVVYQNTFKFLENDFTFVHLEVRGTRGSSFPEDTSLMSSWHMSEDIEALRIYLDLDVLDSIAGHSNGGCIATWYAMRYPSRVLNLLLLGSQLLGPDAEAVRQPATKAILDARTDRDAVKAFLSGSGPQGIPSDEAFAKGMDRCLSLYFARPARDLAKFKREFTNIPQIRCWQLQDLVENNFSAQDSQLGTVAARTLVLVGREDFICPVPVSVMLAERIPRCTLEIVEDGGHFTWVEQEEKFASILKSFYSATY